jgi:hypothetical protein
LPETGRINTLVKAIADELVETSKFSLIGKQITNPEELATAAQVFRDPRYETVRYFFTDAQGNIVGESAFTSRLPGSTVAFTPSDGFDELHTWIQGQMTQHQAEGVWAVHNHPSGVANPSDQDVRITEYLNSRLGDSMKGHVVIDSNEWAHIKTSATTGRTFGNGYEVFKKDFGPDKLLIGPNGPAGAGASEGGIGWMIGMRIASASDAANTAKHVGNIAPDKPVLIGVTAQMRARAVASIDMPDLYSERNQVRAAAQLRSWARNNGANEVFLVLPDALPKSGRILEMYEDAIKRGYLMDVVDFAGNSVRRQNALLFRNSNLWMGTNKTAGARRVAERRSKYRAAQAGMFTSSQEGLGLDAGPSQSPMERAAQRIENAVTKLTDSIAPKPQQAPGAMPDGLFDQQPQQTTQRPSQAAAEEIGGLFALPADDGAGAMPSAGITSEETGGALFGLPPAVDKPTSRRSAGVSSGQRPQVTPLQRIQLLVQQNDLGLVPSDLFAARIEQLRKELPPPGPELAQQANAMRSEYNTLSREYAIQKGAGGSVSLVNDLYRRASNIEYEALKLGIDVKAEVAPIEGGLFSQPAQAVDDGPTPLEQLKQTIADVQAGKIGPDEARAKIDQPASVIDTTAPAAATPATPAMIEPPPTPVNGDALATTARKYSEGRDVRDFQVLEDEYLRQQFALRNRKAARNAEAYRKALAENKNFKGRTMTEKERANYEYWARLDDKVAQETEAAPELVNKWRENYIDTVKMAISKGEKVPPDVVAQRPEFTKAIDARERYEKGRHTSFANKSAGINDAMKTERGFKVKRQDGKPMPPEQVNEIATGVSEFEQVLGNMRDLFDATDITIAHTSGKFPFLKGDAAGLYHQDERTVTFGHVGKLTKKPSNALAHELAHWLDIEAGNKVQAKTRVYSKGGKGGDSTSLAEAAGQYDTLISEALRSMSDRYKADQAAKGHLDKLNLTDVQKDQLQVALGAYWREPREIWARLVEQYVAEKLGRPQVAALSIDHYRNTPAYWTEEAFNKLKPMLEEEIKRRVSILRGAAAEEANRVQFGMNQSPRADGRRWFTAEIGWGQSRPRVEIREESPSSNRWVVEKRTYDPNEREWKSEPLSQPLEYQAAKEAATKWLQDNHGIKVEDGQQVQSRAQSGRAAEISTDTQARELEQAREQLAKAEQVLANSQLTDPQVKAQVRQRIADYRAKIATLEGAQAQPQTPTQPTAPAGATLIDNAPPGGWRPEDRVPEGQRSLNVNRITQPEPVVPAHLQRIGGEPMHKVGDRVNVSKDYRSAMAQQWGAPFKLTQRDLTIVSVEIADDGVPIYRGKDDEGKTWMFHQGQETELIARTRAARRAGAQAKDQELKAQYDQAKAAQANKAQQAADLQQARREADAGQAQDAGFQASAFGDETGGQMSLLEPTADYDANGLPNPDLVRNQDEAVEMGQREGIHFTDLTGAATRENLAAIKALREGFKQHIKDNPTVGAVPADVRAAIMGELGNVTQKFYDTRRNVSQQAKSLVNDSLLDYNLKRGADKWMSLVAPFSYWATRQGRNYALRFMSNPQLLAGYLRYQYWTHEQRKKEQGGRARFGGGWKLPTSAIGEMLPGQPAVPDMYVDPTAWLFPFGQWVNPEMDADTSKSAIQDLYDRAGALGARLTPLADIPLRMSGALMTKRPGEEGYETERAAYGDRSVGQLIPQTGMIQGATALAGIGGPTGVDIERPIRKAMGLPEAEAFDPYRISRSVSNMAATANAEALQAGQKFDAVPYLVAQQFIAQHRDTDLPTALEQYAPDRLAKELSIGQDVATRALEIAREAAGQATRERGFSQLASTLGGVRAQAQPQGEQTRWAMRGVEKGAAYSPYTEQGSRQEVKQVQAALPALKVQRAQYGTIPGETRDYGYLVDVAQKDQINERFDQIKDAVVAMRPWDRKAARAVENARWRALQSVDRQESPDQASWQDELQKALTGAAGIDAPNAPVDYRPVSVAGASPKEAMTIRQNEVMRFISDTRPLAENFISVDTGEIDFDTYNMAVAEWEKNLPRIALGLPQVAAVVAQADGERHGPALRQWLGKLNTSDLANYRQRNDTPVEAAQRAWFDGVYTPTFAAYRKLKDAGDEQAYEKTIGAVGPMDGQQLAEIVKRVYGPRWGDQELADNLRAMQMPALTDVMKANQSPQARAKSEAQTAFWEYYRTSTPPGKASYKMKDMAMIQAALDPAARATLTAEQYKLAYSMMRGWMAENVGEVTPELQAEWAQARTARAQLDISIVQRYGREGLALLAQYEQMPGGRDKEVFRRKNPAVNGILKMRGAYERTDPIYSKYYGSGQSGRRSYKRP